jgi:PQQ-dependent catabolism-associated CXXCW motif protein
MNIEKAARTDIVGRINNFLSAPVLGWALETEERLMRRIIVHAFVWISALSFTVSLHAQQMIQQQRQFRGEYTCSVEGAQARLTSDVVAVEQVVVYMDPTGKNQGVIPTGDVNFQYGGTLVSASSSYTFTGTNSFATFTNQRAPERFDAKFELSPQGDKVLITVNPFGPGPVQYLCNGSYKQVSGPPLQGVPQTGGVPQGGVNPQLGGVPQVGGVPQRGGVPQTGRTVIDLDRLMTLERQDSGVQATRQLHKGEVHGPTPNTIPGGQVVTTKGLEELVKNAKKSPVPVVVIDAMEGRETLPDAIPAAWAGDPGSFDDQTQQRFVQFLQERTKGRKDAAIIIYSDTMECWQSYNAALRAINAGYVNVLWYRGGLEAWTLGGLPTQASARSAAPSILPANSLGR